MKKYISILLLAMFTSSCSNDLKSSLGLKKPSPDEFTVISNPPLSVPPNFTLNKPSSDAEGAINLQDIKTPSHSLNKDEQDFLNRLGAKKGVTKVDRLIDQEYNQSQEMNSKKGTIRKTVSRLNGDDEHYIDPVAEKERIKKNQEEGKSINEGEIKEKSKSTINKIFN
jgi:PBP1b-binding outer membrane lipoprotein LpoB